MLRCFFLFRVDNAEKFLESIAQVNAFFQAFAQGKSKMVFRALAKNPRYCYTDRMGWFNYYGLAVMAIIMLPNIVYAIRHKNDVAPAGYHKAIAVAEQIGRYGCFVCMIFNVPYTYFGFWFANAKIVYLAVNGGLCCAYIVFWILCGNKNGKLRALSLSLLPSCIFVFCGIVLANFPLLAFAVVFAVCHVYISLQSTKPTRRKKPTVEEKYKNEAITILVVLLVALAAIGILFGGASGAFPL